MHSKRPSTLATNALNMLPPLPGGYAYTTRNADQYTSREPMDEVLDMLDQFEQQNSHSLQRHTSSSPNLLHDFRRRGHQLPNAHRNYVDVHPRAQQRQKTHAKRDLWTKDVADGREQYAHAYNSYKYYDQDHDGSRNIGDDSASDLAYSRVSSNSRNMYSDAKNAANRRANALPMHPLIAQQIFSRPPAQQTLPLQQAPRPQLHSAVMGIAQDHLEQVRENQNLYEMLSQVSSENHELRQQLNMYQRMYPQTMQPAAWQAPIQYQQSNLTYAQPPPPPPPYGVQPP